MLARKICEMPSEDEAKTKTNVLIPVTVTLLIPVEIEASITVDGSEQDIDGVPVIDVQQYENGEQMIVDALEAAGKSEDIEEAVGCLLSGANLYKREKPETKALYTPCLGIVDERAF